MRNRDVIAAIVPVIVARVGLDDHLLREGISCMIAHDEMEIGLTPIIELLLEKRGTINVSHSGAETTTIIRDIAHVTSNMGIVIDITSFVTRPIEIESGMRHKNAQRKNSKVVAFMTTETNCRDLELEGNLKYNI